MQFVKSHKLSDKTFAARGGKKKMLQNDLFTRGDLRVSSIGCAVAYSAVLAGSGDVGPSVRGSTRLQN